MICKPSRPNNKASVVNSFHFAASFPMFMFNRNPKGERKTTCSRLIINSFLRYFNLNGFGSFVFSIASFIYELILLVNKPSEAKRNL